MSTSPIGPELAQKIAIWRQRALAGELTKEECIEAVAFLREGRMAAQAASTTARRKTAKAAIPDAEELLKGLMEL